MAKTTTTTPKQPKTVRLGTFIQSLVIAVLMTGIATWIASYFFTINMHADMRQSIVRDITALKAER